MLRACFLERGPLPGSAINFSWAAFETQGKQEQTEPVEEYLMRQIAIVGGGPGGAMCGERLARSSYDVTLYDEHLAWEKPCGGGLTHKAIQAYPFLLNGPHPKKLIHSVELI